MLTKVTQKLIDKIELEVTSIEEGVFQPDGNETVTDRLIQLCSQLLFLLRSIKKFDDKIYTELETIESSFNHSHSFARMTVDRLLEETNVAEDQKDGLRNVRETLDSMWLYFNDIFLMLHQL
jgi:hypothetical protein